jgi:hypothetical protein
MAPRFKTAQVGDLVALIDLNNRVRMDIVGLVMDVDDSKKPTIRFKIWWLDKGYINWEYWGNCGSKYLKVLEKQNVNEK